MDVFVGRITSSGFGSGDRIVIGDWEQSPIGPFTNIMWAKPNGIRVLLSPSERHAEYVSSLYEFEEVHVVSIKVERGIRSIHVEAGELVVRMEWKRGFFIPIRRPLWFISTVEQFFAKLFFGTRTHGKTKNGLKEWYCVQSLAKVNHSSAKENGIDFGDSARFEITACFGFSEPPKRPSSAIVRSTIENLNQRGV
tara:strand:- start:994 stop:1578 length:585 start_codon:yes stop_codon:yes gene_type:complete